MTSRYNVARAQAVYEGLRDLWVADGSCLEAHERLSVITVAAGARDFAFLTQVRATLRASVVSVVESAGLAAGPCSSRFDIDFDVSGISAVTVEGYRRIVRERDRFSGLGIWLPNSPMTCPGMSSLGSALGYPRCCELMDLQTKQRDHALCLDAVVDGVGDEPVQVARALRERRQFGKATEEHCHEWDVRFAATHDLFPFVFHAACESCLESRDSPSGVMNRQYEEIASAVSEELHLMVRWGARAMSDRPDDT